MGVGAAEVLVGGMKTTAVRVEAVEAHGMPTATEAQAVEVVAQARRRVAAREGTVTGLADGVHINKAQRHMEGTRRSCLSKLITYVGNASCLSKLSAYVGNMD